MGPFGSGAALAAAGSNAGAIGTIGGAARSEDDLRSELARVRDLTDRPYIVNFTQPWLQTHPDALDVALEARPAAISLALGEPGDLVQRAHDAGAVFIQQVHTLEQGRSVAARGVDVIIAQGTEAGGFTGSIAMPVLVPLVVDAVTPIPVVAAGGIGDGRGIAAALVLGAQGVNVGTRFLASEEATVSNEWKRAIVAAEAEDAVKAEIWDKIFPKPGGGAFDVVPRSLRTRFIEAGLGGDDVMAADAERLQGEIWTAIAEERMEDFVPFTGQSAGMIRDVRSAARIVEELIVVAEETLRRAGALPS
jgi:nitronate monooxygenase/enoyl-[acyl-carrier protein] reductase II